MTLRSLFRFLSPSSDNATPAPTTEQTNHEIRNAVIGIQLERRKLWQAHEAFDRRIREHMTRIETELRRCGDDDDGR